MKGGDDEREEGKRAHRYLGHCTMTVMQIDMAFGKTGVAVDLPEGFQYRVLEARSAKAVPDWRRALARGARPAHRNAVAYRIGARQTRGDFRAISRGPPRTA